MSKQCAKCTKTVYPIEELKCLDKFWHKACFKCEVCNMTLNMKNYKGYNKLPYCNAHYPTTKFTAVADTPESRRIADNTKIQSNIKYHADFEKQKGTKTSVADDPEVLRIKKNTQHQSNVQYWGLKEQRESMETRRPTEAVDDVTKRGRNPGKISDYNPETDKPDFASPYSQRTSANVVYDSQRGGEVHSQRTQPGSIADYDPLNERNRSAVGNSYSQPDNSMGRNSYNTQPAGYQQPMSAPQAQPQYQPQAQPQYQPPAQPQYQPPAQPQYQPQPQPVRVSQPQPPQQPPQPKQPVWVAVYDYTAADDDEVSFMEGDYIVNTAVIDQGWMTGTVERTGQQGMLPSNYVEQQ